MQTEALDQTHIDSAHAIKAIRTWVTAARQRVAGWEPQPTPEWWNTTRSQLR